MIGIFFYKQKNIHYLYYKKRQNLLPKEQEIPIKEPFKNQNNNLTTSFIPDPNFTNNYSFAEQFQSVNPQNNTITSSELENEVTNKPKNSFVMNYLQKPSEENLEFKAPIINEETDFNGPEYSKIVPDSFEGPENATFLTDNPNVDYSNININNNDIIGTNLQQMAKNEISQLRNERNKNTSPSSSGIAREFSCIGALQTPCEESIAWQPSFIGEQSTIIEPKDGPYKLYKEYPSIWTRSLNDMYKERAIHNAEEWDYYKFFNNRQKWMQFISNNVLNRKDNYCRPISTFDETYCFGNKEY